jgi:DNA polymerase I-like protein with 3'-5' exonuclease and polymerase domains
MYSSQYEFYVTEIQSMWDATSWMTRGGMHIDINALLKHRRDIANAIAQNESSLQATLKWTPNTKSSLDMARLLAELGVQPSKTKKSNKVRIGKDDLLGYAHKYPSSRAILATCLEITRLRTLQSNFLDLALDSNDYYHPTYGLNATATGRYASRGADEGGPQGQNWPHSLLNLVIPDNPGDELTEADLKQAEDMIIAWDSHDKIAMEAFTKGVDSHRLKACWAFRNWDYSAGLPSSVMLVSITEVCDVCKSLGQSQCNHSERFIAKQSGYAFKYQMGPRKLVNKILPTMGIFISENEGKRIKDRIVSPPTSKWQSNTELDLRKSRWLTNLLGRKREFYGILDDGGELLRSALSWKAQSVVGVIAGRAVTRLERSLRLIGPTARLITQRHDSVLVSHSPRDRARVRLALAEAFYSPVNAHGRVLNIPIEVKHGPNWRDLEKEK